jgi:hypothetical protein
VPEIARRRGVTDPHQSTEQRLAQQRKCGELAQKPAVCELDPAPSRGFLTLCMRELEQRLMCFPEYMQATNAGRRQLAAPAFDRESLERMLGTGAPTPRQLLGKERTLQS